MNSEIRRRLQLITNRRNEAVSEVNRLEKQIANLKRELKKALYDNNGKDWLVSRRVRKDLVRIACAKTDVASRLSQINAEFKCLVAEQESEKHSGFCEMFVAIAKETLDREQYLRIANEAHSRFSREYELTEEETDVASA